jgi:hypothetical protein
MTQLPYLCGIVEFLEPVELRFLDEVVHHDATRTTVFFHGALDRFVAFCFA